MSGGTKNARGEGKPVAPSRDASARRVPRAAHLTRPAPVAAERAGVNAPLPPSTGLGVRFWGVRGSFPRAGAGTVRYGGATACIEVRCAGRLFVIDAGTGIVGLGKALVGPQAPVDLGPAPAVDVLLSHLHHDHVMGLPFFAPLLTPGATVRLHVGNLDGRSGEAALDCLFAPPLFPVTLAQLPARVVHHGFRAGDFITFPAEGAVGDEAAPVTVRTFLLNHPSGATAFRFDHGGRSLAYVSDIEHADSGADPALVEFVRGADLVLYDAMFTEGQFVGCRGWGHSTWRAGVALCEAAGAARLAAIHHHPAHDDAMLDAIDAELDLARPGSFVAREGLSLVLDAAEAGAGLAAGAGVTLPPLGERSSDVAPSRAESGRRAVGRAGRAPQEKEAGPR